MLSLSGYFVTVLAVIPVEGFVGRIFGLKVVIYDSSFVFHLNLTANLAGKSIISTGNAGGRCCHGVKIVVLVRAVF